MIHNKTSKVKVEKTRTNCINFQTSQIIIYGKYCPGKYNNF